MSLKSKLNELLSNSKLGEAIDLLMQTVKEADQDTYNALILLKSRHSSNEKDNSIGILSNSDYQRSKNQIMYAFQQTMERVSSNIMENPALGNQNQNSDKGNLPSQKEIDGLNELFEILNDKKLYLEKELITTYDSEKKFALGTQIKEIEKQIHDLKHKITFSSDEISQKTKTEIDNSSSYKQKKIARLIKEIEETDDLLSEWKKKMILAENPTELKRCELEISKLEKFIRISEYELKNLMDK